MSLAWYGAIVATLALLWNIVTWWQEKPRFYVKIRPHTAYPDSKAIKTEIIDGGERQAIQLYYHIEIINRGKIPGTIISIWAEPLVDSSAKITKSLHLPAFVAHLGQNLPYQLDPGGVWSCRVEEGSVDSIKENSKAVLKIDVSYQDKPLIVDFPV